MIVQRYEPSLETSVNKLSFAGSRMSVLSSGAFPVFERLHLAVGLKGWVGNSPAVAALPPLHEVYFRRTLPGIGSLESREWVTASSEVPSCLLACRTGGGDSATDRPDEARELRATAVMATVLRLPLLTSAR